MRNQTEDKELKITKEIYPIGSKVWVDTKSKDLKAGIILEIVNKDRYLVKLLLTKPSSTTQCVVNMRFNNNNLYIRTTRISINH